MLEEYSLRFAAFGIDADERNISAGVADLKLSDLDLTIRPFNAWLYLQDVNKVSLIMSMCRRVQLGLIRANLISQCWMYSKSCSTVVLLEMAENPCWLFRKSAISTQQVVLGFKVKWMHYYDIQKQIKGLFCATIVSLTK